MESCIEAVPTCWPLTNNRSNFAPASYTPTRNVGLLSTGAPVACALTDAAFAVSLVVRENAHAESVASYCNSNPVFCAPSCATTSWNPLGVDDTFTHAETVNDPVVSSALPEVAACDDVPSNDAALALDPINIPVVVLGLTPV